MVQIAKTDQLIETIKQKVYEIIPEKLSKIANNLLASTLEEFNIEMSNLGDVYSFDELETVTTKVTKISDNKWDLEFDTSKLSDKMKTFFEFYMTNARKKSSWSKR